MYSETAFKRILENGPEIAVFMLIDSFWTEIVYLTKGRDDPSLPRRVWESTIKYNFDSLAQIMTLIKGTDKYGVTEPLLEGVPTNQFWRWYRWWRTYFRALTDDQKNMLLLALKNKEDVSLCRPRRDWNK